MLSKLANPEKAILKALTNSLKISFLIKGLKKSHRNNFNYDVSVGKAKILYIRDLIPEN